MSSFKIRDESNELVIGNGINEEVFLGPVIREEHKERTLHYIQSGIEEGASLIRDGRKDHETNGKGYFVGPTIFDHVTNQMKIWQDEIFAPVLSIVRVSSLTEAIDLSNQSKFANGACLYTDSASSIREFRENIEAGMLGVNIGVPRTNGIFPFSGWEGFFLRLHANGTDEVEFYTRKKMVTARYM
ncbi:aldehyde dehydrogenase family protein [Bacillus sp. SL00103]